MSVFKQVIDAIKPLGSITPLDIIKIVIILLVLVLIVIGVNYLKVSIKIKKSDDDIKYVPPSKRKHANKWVSVYDFLNKIPFLKRYILNIKKQYEIRYPSDLKMVKEKSAKLISIYWGISLVAIIVGLIKADTLYFRVTIITVVYLLNNFLVANKFYNMDMKILKDFNRYLGDVRHHYFESEMIDEAIFESLDKATPSMRGHAENMYNILIADDIDEAIEKYNDVVPNQFMKTFVALCVTVMRFGDRVVDGQSMFLSTLIDLKEEINIELLKKQKIDNLFSGLVWVAVLPILSLDIIKKWGISNVPELSEFYNGTEGILIMLALFALTVIVYQIIMRLKSNVRVIEMKHPLLNKMTKIPFIKTMLDNYVGTHYGKVLQMREVLKKVGEGYTEREFLLKRALYAFSIFFLLLFLMINVHIINRVNIVTDFESVENITNGASEKDVLLMKEVIAEYVGKYKDSILDESNANFADIIVDSANKVENSLDMDNLQNGDNTLTEEDKALTDGKINAATIAALIEQDKSLKSDALIDLSAGEVINRINKYQNEYFHYYELIFIFIVAYIGWLYPYIMLKYRMKLLQMDMQDEVIQFQSIIIMLIYIDQMTIDHILEWLERFAVIFRPSITICLNELNGGDVQALDNLIKREPFESFARIIENLKMADRIGIQKAFNELSVDRANYQATRKQENEIQIAKKGSISAFLANIPISAIIIFYLIYPFVKTSMGMLSNYMAQIASM